MLLCFPQFIFLHLRSCCCLLIWMSISLESDQLQFYSRQISVSILLLFLFPSTLFCASFAPFLFLSKSRVTVRFVPLRMKLENWIPSSHSRSSNSGYRNHRKYSMHIAGKKKPWPDSGSSGMACICNAYRALNIVEKRRTRNTLTHTEQREWYGKRETQRDDEWNIMKTMCEIKYEWHKSLKETTNRPKK